MTGIRQQRSTTCSYLQRVRQGYVTFIYRAEAAAATSRQPCTLLLGENNNKVILLLELLQQPVDLPPIMIGLTEIPVTHRT